MSDSIIRTTTHANCALCTRAGKLLYANLKDELFGTVGSWCLFQCSDPRCGLVWMNPMPLAEDLSKAYDAYYTHERERARGTQNYAKRAYRKIKRAYLASRYGYSMPSGVPGGLGWLLYLAPTRRSGVDSEVRYLRARPGGRLLDVGCGSGSWLDEMRNLGWEVRGIDFDAEAVSTAVRRGLDVDHGSLEARFYPAESFEAITLNHVLEHLPDPRSTLIECRRILHADGRLVLITPNSASVGHAVFRERWRGLEPPRHLHLFCPSSIRTLLKAAGFRRFEVRTVASDYLLRHSVSSLGQQLSWHLGITPYVLMKLEQLMLLAGREVGECLVVEALKS